MTATKTNSRQAVLLALGLLGLLFLGYHFFWSPLQAYNSQAAGLASDISDKQEERDRILRAKPQLQRWQRQSLPADKYLASREYERYLSDILARSDVQVEALNQAPLAGEARGPGATGKKVYTPLDFNISGRGTLASLTQLLERFRQTPLLHKVKSLSIEPADSRQPRGPKEARQLKIHLVVEALVLQGADAIQPNLSGVNGQLLELDVLNALARGPAWLTLLSQAGSTRDYARIARKDIFTGPLPAAAAANNAVNVTPYVYLSKITQDGPTPYAYLRDRYNDHRLIRLETAKGFNSFRIRDSEGEELLKGEVVRIEQRDVYFQADGHEYVLHIGESLSDALERRTAMERPRRRERRQEGRHKGEKGKHREDVQ